MPKYQKRSASPMGIVTRAEALCRTELPSMLKATVKSFLAHASRWSGRLHAAETRQDGALSVLCFHRVLPASERAAYFDPVLAVTPEAFDAICATLAAHARVLPLAEAVAAQREQGPDGERIVALTFDDGYRDNLIHAAPILARHGLRASFYVVADLIGTEQPPWYDRMGRVVQELARAGQDVGEPTEVVAAAKELGSAGRRERLAELEGRLAQAPVYAEPDRLMSAAQLRELIAAGHEVGSHSCSHEILPQLDDAALADEIQRSKAVLESETQAAVRSFCFPNGDYDARCLQLVEQEGYEAALTTLPGVNDAQRSRLELQRHFVHQDAWSGPSGALSPTWVRYVTAGFTDRSRGGSS